LLNAITTDCRSKSRETKSRKPLELFAELT
jgi:hypothetical protein